MRSEAAQTSASKKDDRRATGLFRIDFRSFNEISLVWITGGRYVGSDKRGFVS